MRYLLFTSISSLFVSILVFLVLAFFTGKKDRTYKALLPEDLITFCGHNISTNELAEKYVPLIYKRNTTPSPNLLWIWYDCVKRTDNCIDIIYHPTWENEINPSSFLFYLYSFFRAAYYGYPLYDIEFIQITIDLTSGNIKRVLHETNINDEYYPEFPQHYIAEITKTTNGYQKTIKNKNGNILQKKDIQLFTIESHLVLGVQTWNHLTRLVEINDPIHFNQHMPATLRFLTDKEFCEYKFARKSQSDYKVTSNNIILYLSTMIIFLCINLIGYILYRKRKRLHTNHAKTN